MFLAVIVTVARLRRDGLPRSRKNDVGVTETESETAGAPTRKTICAEPRTGSPLARPVAWRVSRDVSGLTALTLKENARVWPVPSEKLRTAGAEITATELLDDVSPCPSEIPRTGLPTAVTRPVTVVVEPVLIPAGETAAESETSSDAFAAGGAAPRRAATFREAPNAKRGDQPDLLAA